MEAKGISVLVLAHVFPRALEDSMGAFLLHLADGLAGCGTQTAVVAPHAPNLANSEVFGAAQVHRFRYAPARWERLAYTGTMHELVARGILSKLLFAFFNVAFLVKAVAVARTLRPNLLHAHWVIPGGLVGALAARLTGLPLVITTHGTDVEMLRRTKWAQPLARRIFAGARAVTCGSTYLEEQLVALGIVDRERMTVIPMPVSREFQVSSRKTGGTSAALRGFRSQVQDRAISTCNLKPETYNPILAVARLTKQKSIDTLIDAVAELRERGCAARLTIIGDGPERMGLQAQVRALGLEEQVEFLGALPQVELPRYYAGCRVFVLPSVREGMGLVLAEALLCGAPVIATNSGGVADIVRDGETGLAVPERDSQALAEAIQKLLQDPALAARLAANGGAYVRERYALEPVARQFHELYRRVLAV